MKLYRHPWLPNALLEEVSDMARVLITGGCGFIGSNLAERLIAAGNEVSLIDIKEHPANIGEFKRDVSFIRQDVRSSTRLSDLLHAQSFDGIVHLAAVSRVIWGEKNPERCASVNVEGTRVLLEAVSKLETSPWFVFGSSREVYGEPISLPVTEAFPKKPLNIYGYTKLVGEAIVRQYTERFGLRSCILRFSNVYGGSRDILDRVIPRFILAGLQGDPIEIHGGDQVFDFTHIDDTVTGIVGAMNLLQRTGDNENGSSSFCEDFHLLTGHGCTLQNVVSSIERHLGQDVAVRYTEPRNYDVERFQGDPAKARELLGFEASILPEAGVPRTIDRFREVFGS
jgi:nucleoside-diphosphate-sugar epimerase